MEGEARVTDPEALAPPPIVHTIRDLVEVLDPRQWIAPAGQSDLPRGDGHPVLFAPGVGTGDLPPLRCAASSGGSATPPMDGALG